MRKRTRRLMVLALAFIATLMLLYLIINRYVRPALSQIAQVRVSALASDAMYSAVLEMLSQEDLEPFVDIAATGGTVTFVELNNRVLTKFASACAQEAQARLLSYGTQGVAIPLGSVSGVPMFSGKGPPLIMTFYPETNTQAHFSSEFRAAGINQTLHRVMLRLEVQIAIVLPTHTEIVRTYVDVPIAEHIIVGPVPDYYSGTEGDDDLLNLLPQ